MVKILLCGGVQGQWASLFERVRKLNASAKGLPFELLVCVGRVLPFPPEYLSGERQVPISTYLLPADEQSNEEQAGEQQQQQLIAKIKTAKAEESPLEIAPNCFCLAGHGVTTIAGLSVAYLSGTKAAESGASVGPFQYSDEDVQSLTKQIADAGKTTDLDFLFTAELPASFQNLLPEQQLPPELQKLQGSASLARMLEVVLPKYHITSDSSAGVFYQRLPYVSEHAASGRKQLSRLIGLSGVSQSKDKTKKYLHALQVVPTSTLSSDEQSHVDIPAGTTQNPYLLAAQQQDAEPSLKRRKTDATSGGLSAEQVAQLTQQSSSSSQFFYDQRLAERGQRRDNLVAHPNQRQHDRRNNRSQIPERTECWFCLATPTLERHLIVSIGEEAYLAMPKGAISVDHVLIVPIAHEVSSMKLSSTAWKEIDRFKAALREHFAAQDKELLVFDRNTTTISTTHCHLQCIGVPRAKAAAARQIFEAEGEKYNVKFEELGPEDELPARTGGKLFFYAEVPDGQGGTARLLSVVDGKHYVQFGRHAAACVVGQPRRSNWKFCVVPKAEEDELTQAFKQTWRPFDFTLDGDDDDE